MYFFRRGQAVEGNQQMEDNEEGNKQVLVCVIQNDFPEDEVDRGDSQGSEEGYGDMRVPGVLRNKENFNSTCLLLRPEQRIGGDVGNWNIQTEDEGYPNQGFREVDSQQPVEGCENMSSPETVNNELRGQNVGNQQRDSSHEQENESARETNQQSTRIYEEIDAPHASSITQETCSGALPAPASRSATPHDADQGDASSSYDNQLCPETERQAVEHDDNGDSGSTYANAVQCTDDSQKTSLHKQLWVNGEYENQFVKFSPNANDGLF